VKRLKTVTIFLICGFLAGAFFGWLLSLSRLESFWYIKGHKFLIPTYRYYLGIGVFLLLGLAFAYSIARLSKWITMTRSFLRLGSAATIIATSTLLVFALLIWPRDAPLDPETLFLTGALLFVFLISIAFWIASGRLYYLGLLVNLLTIPVEIAIVLLLARTMPNLSEWSQLVSWSIYDSLLAGACGFWIARGNSSAAV
jgi:hypothetical protein